METEAFEVINYTILAIILIFLSIFFSWFHTRKKKSKLNQYCFTGML